MKNSRNIAIGIAAIVPGLIFGVFVGARLGPLKTITPNGSTPLPATTESKPSPPTATQPLQVPDSSRVNQTVLPDSKPKPSGSTPDTAHPLTTHDLPEEASDLSQPATANRSTETPAKKEKLENAPVVCIDPGHPSETSDGANAHGLSENRLNWQVAVRLRDILEKQGVRCVLTKQSENQKVTNRERAEIANKARALVFIRLHCDVGSGSGFTWYYPDRTGNKQGVSGPSKDIQLASREAAFTINEAMKPILKGHLKSNAIKTDASTFVGGKQGGVLTGSIFARVPTALIEMCFINEKHDAQFIASEQGRNKMAEALASGIQSYINR